MTTEASVFLGKGDTAQYLYLRFANRHGLIAGATGTGKTVTLQGLAEGFSGQGVPVFMADIKGDLSGISQPGKEDPKLAQRAKDLGVPNYRYEGFPTLYWDLLGEQGHPIRTTVTEMGPVLLSRLLGLNETQEGVLNVVFRVADEQGLLLLDLKDLRSVLVFAGEQSKGLTLEYGTVQKASVGAIQRKILELQQQGGDKFFGEPALNLTDFMRTDSDGRGYLNVLAADKLMMQPKLYATFMLWLLAELFEELPEVGDPEKPPRLLLRRSSSAPCRRAQSAYRPSGASRPVDPVKGCRRVFHLPEPTGHTGSRPRATGEPYPTRDASVYPPRSKSGTSGCRNVQGQPEVRCRQGDHGTGSR